MHQSADPLNSGYRGTKPRPPETFASITWAFLRLGAKFLSCFAVFAVMLIGFVDRGGPRADAFTWATLSLSVFCLAAGAVLIFKADKSTAPGHLKTVGKICLLVPLAFIIAAVTAGIFQT